LAKILANRDPARALEVLGDLYAKCPDAASRQTWTRYPDGSGSGGGGVTGFSEFIAALSAKEPEQTMQTLLDLEARNPSTAGSNPFYGSYNLTSHQAARVWAAKDFGAFAAWSEAQTEPALRDAGAHVASEQLRNANDFAGGAAWALRISDQNAQSSALSNVVSSWVSRDQAAAQRWFEETDLPEQTRKNLAPYFRARQ
jgi:hypothetical protein